MRVALFSYNAESTNGWGNFTLNFASTLYEKGVDFKLFLPHGHPRIEQTWHDRAQYILPNTSLLFRHPRSVKALGSSLLPFRAFDLLHSLFALPMLYPAFRAARKYAIPYVLGEQGTYAIVPLLNPIDKFFYLRMLSQAASYIVPSWFTRNLLLNFHNSPALESKLQVIHNGINYRQFAQPLESPQKPERGAALEFIGVGALKPRKGFDLTIQAIAKAAAIHPSIVLKIVGTGPAEYKRYLEQLAQQLGIGEKVRFLGQLPIDQLVSEMRRSYAYIHLSICREWHFEGFGMVYVEANACGIPSIGPISGGVPDAINVGVSGLLCKEGDIDSACDCIVRLIENPQLYQQLCSGAVNWAEQHDWSNIVDEYLKVYASALSRR